MTIRVAKLADDGENWNLLGVYEDYDAADDAIDFFTDKFPNAYVDILDGALGNIRTL